MGKKTEWDDQRRFDLVKALLPNKWLLDFGCGAAGFLQRAKNLVAEVSERELDSNHLHWLSRGKLGGRELWAFLDTPELASAYTATLAAIGKTDTLIVHLEHGA